MTSGNVPVNNLSGMNWNECIQKEDIPPGNSMERDKTLYDNAELIMMKRKSNVEEPGFLSPLPRLVRLFLLFIYATEIYYIYEF